MALTALSRACANKQNQGGVKNLWINEAANITSLTAGTGADLYTYTACVAASPWKLIEFEEYTTKLESNSKGKPSVNETMLEGYIALLLPANLLWLENARLGCKYVVAAEYFNGTKILMGWDEKLEEQAGLDFEEYKLVGGESLSTAQGATVTFKGMQIEVPYSFTFTPSVS